jgi:hypothetical protein
MTSLGLVASGKRAIKNGSEFNAYFDLGQVKGQEVELMEAGSVYDTLKQMHKIVRSTLPQTKRIASKLKASSREATCRNIFNFLYEHVQYKKDNPLREQLRTPLRTWKDRTTGVDCDCFSIFISSILTNLDIPHAFRMAGYKGDFQHVYVVVPKSGNSVSSGYYTIDPVVDRFNYETPFNKKHDHMTTSPVTTLNGLGACKTEALRRYAYTDQLQDFGFVPSEQFLQAHGFSYEKVTDPTREGGVLVVFTSAGAINLPTVLSKTDSEKFLSTYTPGTPTTPQPSEKPCACQNNKKKFWLGWLAVGAASLLLLTGSHQDEVKPGLNGAPRRKPKTIHI